MEQTKTINLTELSGGELREMFETLRRSSVGLPYEIYKAKAMVLINEMNRRGELIAKKYNKKYRPLTFKELR